MYYAVTLSIYIGSRITRCSLKNDKDITAVQIERSEFLLSQYADDSSLVLDDNPKSLEKSLLVLSLFSECSGLKVNLNKTEAISIGSKHGSGEEYFSQNNITWNHTGRFKLLGIKCDLNSPDKTLLNFPDKLQSINKILSDWCWHDLTFIGKITVIKSLALPILIQSLTVLPNPSDNILKDIQKLFLKFLWNGKRNKVKREILTNSYEDGGLKMIDIKLFCQALKMTWIKKYIDPLKCIVRKYWN